MKEIEFWDNEECEIVNVEDCFIFSVTYHNRFSSRDWIPESSITIIPWGVSVICLNKENESFQLMVKQNDKLENLSEELNSFFRLYGERNQPINLRMLFYAIKDAAKSGLWKDFSSDSTYSIRLIDLFGNYN
jgi:hypothetical protein